MQNIISVKHLFKTFNNMPILKDINLDIAQGERIVITGPSGSGKSTLLRCLNLLEIPTAGDIYFMGQNILDPYCDIHKVRQKMCMVFQQFNLFFNFSVLDNITLAPTKLLAKDPTQARYEARNLLEQFGLLDKAEYYPSKLSGGQKQRVAILRALAMSPKVMLFDEPTSALDPFMKNEVQNLINVLGQENMTMIIITHDMDFAKNIATRIFSIENHQLIPVQQ
ncbi:MAG: amino acid ABC transporter ATP-binding protein [Oscillospiraceae bacterium]